MRGDGRREDQLRAPVYALLKELGDILGQKVHVHDEVTLSDGSARPRLCCRYGSRSGWVHRTQSIRKRESLIRIGDRLKHDRDQLDKLRVLPNLIYTNGNYWGLY